MQELIEPKGKAEGVVIESNRTRVLLLVLVQKGTLKKMITWLMRAEGRLT